MVLLPGLEISDDGEMYFNGRKVRNLKINGRNFFRKNKKVALNNLSTRLVDKVRVFDEKTEHAYLYENPSGLNGQLTIDVVFRKEYAIGLDVNAEAGGGYPLNGENVGLYGARAFGMGFTDNSNLTIYANANNLNDDKSPGRLGRFKTTAYDKGRATLQSIGADYGYTNKSRKINISSSIEAEHSNALTVSQTDEYWGNESYMSRLSNAKNLGRNSWRIEGNHYQTMKWEKAYIKFEPNIRYTGNDETEYEKQQQYVANGIDADLYKEIYSRNMDTRRDYGKLLFRNQLEGYFRLPFAKTPFSFEWNFKYDGEHNNETITDTLLSLKTRELRKDLKPTGELTSDFNISKELKSWKGKSLSTTLGLKYCYNYFRATGERLRMQADPSMPDEEWIVMGGDSYNTIKYHHNHGCEINIDVHEKHGWNLSTKLRGGYIQRGIHDVRSFIH